MVQYIMDERDGGEQPQRPLMMIRRFSSPGYDAKLNHQSSLGPQSLRRTQSLQERYTVSPHSLRSVNSLVRARIEAARSCGRDSKQLSEETEQMRERLTQQRTLNRLVSSRELADENRQLRRRLSATGGRDVKALSEQTELARSRSIQRRRSENEARSASLREANAAFRQRLEKAAQQGRDAKELSEEVQAARIKAQERRQAEKTAAKHSLANANQKFAERLFSTVPRSVTSLSREDEEAREEAHRGLMERKAAELEARQQRNRELLGRLVSARSSGRDEKALAPETEAARERLRLRREEQRESARRSLSARNGAMSLRIRTAEARVAHRPSPQEEELREKIRQQWQEGKLQRTFQALQDSQDQLSRRPMSGFSSLPVAVA